MSRWWRAYEDAVDDPKLQRLPADTFKAWFNLLCLASRNGGVLPSVEDIAFSLRKTETQVETLIETLRERCLIDNKDGHLEPHNWNGRQYKSDVSTERVRAFRKRERNVSETVDETPPETETETEQKEYRGNADFEEFWKAYPRRDGANPKTPAEKKFKAAVRSGTEPAKILASARRYAAEEASKGRVGTPYIAQAVTWLNQRRWEDYQPIVNSEPKGVTIRFDTPQWEAWKKHRGSLPETMSGTWTVPTEWPPGYEPQETIQ